MHFALLSEGGRSQARKNHSRDSRIYVGPHESYAPYGREQYYQEGSVYCTLKFNHGDGYSLYCAVNRLINYENPIARLFSWFESNRWQQWTHSAGAKKMTKEESGRTFSSVVRHELRAITLRFFLSNLERGELLNGLTGPYI